MKDKLKRAWLLARCLFSVLSRGTRKAEVAVPKKIVIMQLSKLGDMVCTTPMFKAVKEKYPDTSLTIVGDKINKDLLEGHPYVDGYIVWDKHDLNSTIKRLRAERFDFGCMTGPNFEGLVALFLSGISAIAAPVVVHGWSPYETKPYKILRKFVIQKSHTMGLYAPREYLHLLEPLQIFATDTRKTLVHSVRGEEEVNKFFADHNIERSRKIVGISVTAGNKVKEWPEERFAQVADHLFKKWQAQVLIIGGPKDSETVDRVRSLVSPEARAFSVTGFSIDGLKALISQLTLFIAVDTGPVYIAEAYGIPTIDIVGPMDENEQPPRSPINKVVVPKGRVKPELHIMNARSYDEEKALEQVLAITAEEVIAAVDELMNNLER